MLDSNNDPRIAAIVALVVGVFALLSIEVVALVLGAAGMVTGSLALWLVSSHLKDIDREAVMQAKRATDLASTAEEIIHNIHND